MDCPVTLMMQKTLLVKKDQAGNQDAKKKRTLNALRASALRRRRRIAVAVGIGVGGVGGLERGGRREWEGRVRYRDVLRRWRRGWKGRRRVGIDASA